MTPPLVALLHCNVTMLLSRWSRQISILHCLLQRIITPAPTKTSVRVYRVLPFRHHHHLPTRLKKLTKALMTPRLLVQRIFMWWTLYGGFEKRDEACWWTKMRGEGICEVFGVLFWGMTFYNHHRHRDNTLAATRDKALQAGYTCARLWTTSLDRSHV